MANSFCLSQCDVIGFDLDHTLCRYQLHESNKLIYESFAQYLVTEKGYSEELLCVSPEEWDFCSKGLVLDLEEGNFLKLDANGIVLRATHGTKSMTGEEIEEVYGEKREWKNFNTINGTYTRSAKYYFYDNHFDLPSALLCAKIVDCIEMTEGQKKYDFWKDIVAAIEHNYKTTAFKENCGTFFPAVKKDPSKYLKPCSDAVKHWLRDLKNSGKTLLLITSSHSDYCRLLCEHILGKNFEELFDIIITNALKPGFFSLTPQQRPFWALEYYGMDQKWNTYPVSLEERSKLKELLMEDITYILYDYKGNDEEIHMLPSLEKPGWYSQGNWIHLSELLKKITEKSEPKVVYFGDSMRSDIFSAHHYSNWETVLIFEELEGEEVYKPNMTDRRSSLKKKGKYDNQYTISKTWGSYFADNMSGIHGLQDVSSLTWCCTSIRNYSTIAIPSIASIVDLPLDYKFSRFSADNLETEGYYPYLPQALIQEK